MTPEEQAVQKALDDKLNAKFAEFQKTTLDPALKKFEAQGVEKTDIEKFKGEVDSQFAKLTEAQATVVKNLEDKLASSSIYGSGQARQKSNLDTINEMLEAKEFDNLHDAVFKSKAKDFEMPLMQKADQLMASVGAGVVIPQRTIQEIVKAPFSPFHMSDIVDRGMATNTNTISYTREASYTDGTAYVAEGATFADTNQTLEEITDTVRKIGTREVFSSEILMNVPRLLTYLIPKMQERLEVFKDVAILTGTNTGGQIRGIKPSAQTYAYSAALGNKVASPNILDLIVKASLMATNLFYRPNLVLMHPSDYSDMILSKSTTGEYNIDGTMLITDKFVIPILTSPIITQNTLLLGDFQNACDWVTQVAPTLQFSTEEKFSDDKVVARIKTLGGMQIVQPNAFVNVASISASLTALAPV